MKLSEIKKISYQRTTKKFYAHLMRHLAIPFTWLFLLLNLTANQVTILGIIAGYVATYFLTIGHFWCSLVAVLLLYFGEVTDYSDGTIARIKGLVKGDESRLQSDLLCHFYHQGAYSLIYLGIGIGLFNAVGNYMYIVLGALAGIGFMTTAYIFEMKHALLREYRHESVEGKKNVQMGSVGIDSKLKKLMLDMFVFPVKNIREILFIFVILQRLDIMLIFYGIFLPLRALIFFASTYSFFGAEERKMRMKKRKRK